MSAVLYPPSRPISIGETLDLALRIFRTTLLGCLPYSALAVVVSQAPNIYEHFAGLSHERFGARSPLWWVILGGGTLVLLLLWGVVLVRQYSVARGVITETTRAAQLKMVAARLPSLVVLFAVGAVAVGIVVVPLLALPKTLRIWAALVLAFPAIYVAVLLPGAWASLLLTGSGVLESVINGHKLVVGHRLRIIVTFVVALVMLMVFYGLTAVVVGLIVPIIGGGDLAVVTSLASVVMVALGAFAAPFLSALVLTTVGDLEIRRREAGEATAVLGVTATSD